MPSKSNSEQEFWHAFRMTIRSLSDVAEKLRGRSLKNDRPQKKLVRKDGISRSKREPKGSASHTTSGRKKSTEKGSKATKAEKPKKGKADTKEQSSKAALQGKPVSTKSPSEKKRNLARKTKQVAWAKAHLPAEEVKRIVETPDAKLRRLAFEKSKAATAKRKQLAEANILERPGTRGSYGKSWTSRVWTKENIRRTGFAPPEMVDAVHAMNDARMAAKLREVLKRPAVHNWSPNDWSKSNPDLKWEDAWVWPGLVWSAEYSMADALKKAKTYKHIVWSVDVKTGKPVKTRRDFSKCSKGISKELHKFPHGLLSIGKTTSRKRSSKKQRAGLKKFNKSRKQAPKKAKSPGKGVPAPDVKTGAESPKKPAPETEKRQRKRRALVEETPIVALHDPHARPTFVVGGVFWNVACMKYKITKVSETGAIQSMEPWKG
jgi:hypothetical protein